MDERPSFTRAWYEQWSSAAEALLAVHDAELRALTPDEALRRSDALLSMASVSETLAVIPEDRGLTSSCTRFSRRATRIGSTFEEVVVRRGAELDRSTIWSELLPLLELKDDRLRALLG